MTIAKQSLTNVTRGVHHVGLTVPSVTETTNFFVDVLGYTKVGERAEYPATFVSDGSTTITLWQAIDPDNAAPFDRKRVIGLHHLAIAVESHVALAALHDRLLVTPGVAIEFAPQQQGAGNNQHMMCGIPGGIRVEFNAPASIASN